MEFGETVRSSIRTLWSHKMRSALTMLGIVIGTGALVAVMSLIAGLNRTVAAQFQSVGTDIISVSRYPWVQVGDQEEYQNRKNITDGGRGGRRAPAVGRARGAEHPHAPQHLVRRETSSGSPS